MSHGDPAVRAQLEPKGQLKHWRKVYQWGATYMPILVVGGAIAAIASYVQTKNNTWLYGAATLGSIVPYTMLAMRKTNGNLKDTLEKSGEADLKEDDKKTVIETLKKWVCLHTGRVFLALSAATIFFVAKEQSKSLILKV